MATTLALAVGAMVFATLTIHVDWYERWLERRRQHRERGPKETALRAYYKRRWLGLFGSLAVVCAITSFLRVVRG